MSKSQPSQPLPFKAPEVFRSAVFAVLFTIAAIMAGLGALMALSGDERVAANAVPVLRWNLVLVTGLAVYLFVRMATILFRSEAGRSAPHLHRRFIVIFSLAALVPAILVGIFSTAIMSRNLEDIFGKDVAQTMDNTRDVSNAYLNKEIRDLRQGVLDIAVDLNRVEPQFANRITYSAFLINQAVFREFPVVYVIDGQGRILAQAEGPDTPEFVLPDEEIMKSARGGTLTISSRNEIDFLVALYKLENYKDAYLYTGRYVQAGLLPTLDRIEEVKTALASYGKANETLKKVFKLTYNEIALLILLAAIWLGMVLANRIVSPLGEMVHAAEKVREGDLETRVNVRGVWDEIADLGNAFNRMTKQLFSQRQELMQEHDISEQRRQFSEAVLSGVSAGVIGLSPEGRINVINASAESLLGLSGKDVVGKPLAKVLPSFLPVFNAAKEALDNKIEDQVNLETGSGTKNLDVRISAYREHDPGAGWVITFDDITRLVAAQRHSAWREVARRIAHEIKNPLTPIQLSAERLERKYQSEIKTDPDVFMNCTRTISRQVGNLGRMVDEFSAFARMPTPVLQTIKLQTLLSETIFAARVAFPDIAFDFDPSAIPDVEILCDERLISQALTNIYKNAGEAISRQMEKSGSDTYRGRIHTGVTVENNMVCIDIRDNGPGWPLEDRERLLEPYMTTRDEGSGLGLAIVKRIAEDHGGTLELVASRAGERGAHVRFCLPITAANEAQVFPGARKQTVE